MTIRELVSHIDPKTVIHGNLDAEVTNIQFDSRKVTAGTLFVAQKGTQSDGRVFIPAALEAGAVGAVEDTDNRALGLLAAAFYGEPSKHLTLVGVTGTNGKTTIATLLYKLTRAMGHKAGLLSTVVNYIDDQAVEATHTTPDALELNRLLHDMVEAGCEYAFMEVSSHAIAQERIAGLDFDGALFTNLTRDHLDYHKTFDNYRDTKKRLFDNLKKEAFAVTNKDDKNGLVMTQNCKARVSTYSTRAMADFKAQILEEGFDGMLLQVNGQEVFVPLVGRFNVSNLLCIYGAAINLGFEPTEVLRVLSTLRPVNGRFETIHSPKGWTAIIDYAHTPDAVDNVIQTIREIINHKSEIINPKYDVVVSNPPYVRHSEAADMSASVLDYEPHSALFVPDNDPLLFYRRIAEFLITNRKSQITNRESLLFFEINESFGPAVCHLLDGLGYTDIQLYHDSYGKDRFVSARLIG